MVKKSKAGLRMMRTFLVLLLLMLAILSSHSQSTGKCTILTALSRELELNITCFGVIDYTYFLPTGMTTDDLNSKAFDQLSDARYLILPLKCQVSLKKAVCSNIYLRCPKFFDKVNLTTYDRSIFKDIGVNFPLPFQRPCVNICNNANYDCLGLLNIFGKAINCLERYDYSHTEYGKSIGNISYSSPFPYFYDQSNNSKNCNNIPAVVTVAGTMEPYIYAEKGGACAGILTSLYVPSGPVISSSLAPMQKSYVVQSVIEKKLSVGTLKL